jgi:hypothetical protein
MSESFSPGKVSAAHGSNKTETSFCGRTPSAVVIPDEMESTMDEANIGIILLRRRFRNDEQARGNQRSEK